MAATSSIQNMPGGAGIVQWMAAPDGTHTLINIQNTLATCAGGGSAAIMIHVSFYDWNSGHLFDINWPMSPQDNIGIAVTGDGTLVNLEFEPGETLGSGQFNEPPAIHAFALAGLGDDELQFGYATVAITAMDAVAPAGCYGGDALPLAAWIPFGGWGDGDPTNDPTMAGQPVVLPNMLFARAAIMFPDGVLGSNGVMLQDFANMTVLDEGVASQTFTNITGPDANCGPGTVDWNNDGAINLTVLNDFNGVDIATPELYFTVNHADIDVDGQIEVALTACNRGGIRTALGSYNTLYWGRYNVTPGLTDTSLMAVFPANSATALNPASLIAFNRTFAALAFDDDEHPVSTPPVNGPEVIIAPFYSATNPARPGMPTIQHSTYTHGEVLIDTNRVPMFGFVYTTVAGIGSDIYPLIMEQVGIQTDNEGLGAAGPGITVLP